MFEARFQTFEDRTERAASGPRVAALRAELARRGLTGFIVPRADRHQNEYVPASEERLAWLTGFTGSAGAAIVLLDRAVLFVDGRYTLQVARAGRHLAVRDRASGRDPAGQMARGQPHERRAPRLRPVAAHGRRRRAAGQGLRRGRRDAGRRSSPIRSTRSGPTALPRRSAPVTLHDLRFAGEAAERQARAHPRRDRQAARRRAGRLRSARRRLDLQHPRRGRRAHAAAARLRDRSAGGPARALCRRPQALERGARRVSKRSPTCASRPISRRRSGRARRKRRKTVRLDQATAADALARLVIEPAAARSRAAADPIALMKAVKNAGRDRRRARRACARRRGGGALPRLVRSRGAARQAHRDRRGRGAGKLPPRHRPAQGHFVPDHLRRRARTARSCITASRSKTNRAIAPGELFLIDSGAQYEDGTTDITRTVAVGEPTAEMRDRFTRVLKGHIAIARAVFPDGTTGAQLDSFARQFSVAGRPRFRPRHRPRRRQLSLGARRPGAHLQARHRRRSSAA